VLPIEHFILAIVPVSVVTLVYTRRPPRSRLIGAVFLGSQFPDLIDKPLALQLGVIPTGRVFMHSLPIAIPFLLAVCLYGSHTDQLTVSVALAFTFAHLSHLLGDTYHAIGNPTSPLPPDLFWPLTTPVARPGLPHWAGPNSINIHLWTAFSVCTLTAAVWWLTMAANQSEPT